MRASHFVSFSSPSAAGRLVVTVLALVMVSAPVVNAGDFDMHLDIAMAGGFGSVFVGRSLTNLQTFTAALGGVTASPITNSGDKSRPFEVDGDTFPDFASAADRSCSNQHNGCADAANAKASGNEGLTVSDCDQQETLCQSTQKSATVTSFQAATTSNAEFDFFCDP